jgi:translation initiation factor IF-2
VDNIRTQLLEQGLKTNLFWLNDDLAETVPLIPTSAQTGEGISDLLRIFACLTQERVTVRLFRPLLRPHQISGIINVFELLAMHNLGCD